MYRLGFEQNAARFELERLYETLRGVQQIPSTAGFHDEIEAPWPHGPDWMGRPLLILEVFEDPHHVRMIQALEHLERTANATPFAKALESLEVCWP